MVSVWQALIVLGIILVVFNRNKLVELGGGLGEAIQAFKKGLKSGDKES